MPRAFFEYADSGSYAEETLRANRADLERIKLRQRVLVNVEKRDLSTTIVGQKASLPIALAPIGLCGMQHGDGEILRRARGERGRHSVLPVHHVDLLDRRCGGGDRQAVLVPGLCDPRPRHSSRT